MQPVQDPFAIPRRALDMEDYIDVVRRHRAWILGPVFASLVTAVVVAFLWPDTYVSRALIHVTPPQIPDRLVQSTVTAEMNQRINTMAQAIMSRTALTNMVNSMNLYPRDRRRLPMEDVIETMRKEIKIGAVGVVGAAAAGPDQKVNAFQITFAYENRILAQKVCQDLVSKFIDENVRFRSSATLQTLEFMKDQLDERRKRMDEIDKKITEFRMANMGKLPEQVTQNTAAMNVLENRLGNLNLTVARARQDQLILEGQLQTLKDNLKFYSRPVAPLEGIGGVGGKSERALSAERDLLNAETRLQAAMEQYRDNHPDVQSMKATVAVLKRSRDAITKDDETRKTPSDPGAARAMQSLNVARDRDVQEINTRIAQTQSQIEAKKMEITQLQQDLNLTQGQSRAIEQRVLAVPLGEAKYDELLRERSLAKTGYDDISQKMMSSDLSKRVEERKQGELLEMLDPASLPLTPTEPTRSVIVGAGAGIGLVLGMLIAAAREMKDGTLKNLKDVRAYTQLTVLGSIPLLENDLVVRRRRRLAWLAWSTACLAGCMIMAGSVIFYFTNRDVIK